MKLKRFYAPSMREAMKEVRATLGPDAVIISNQKSNNGIELLAAIEFDEAEFQSMTNEEEVEPSISVSRKPVMLEYEDPNIHQLRHQIEALTEFTEQQFSKLNWKDKAFQQPREAHILRRLANLGLKIDVCKDIIKRTSLTLDLDENWENALTTLRNIIPVCNDDLIQKGGVVAFLGPTGVGKTTTLAKLAAHFCMYNNPDELGLVTMDTYRIGAIEQLQMYGNILGVKPYVIENPEQVNSVLDSLSTKKLILIDTAGMSQRDTRLTEQLQALQLSRHDVQNSLVISASSQYSVLQDIIKVFEQFDLQHCILTKLDESTNIGEAISVLIENSLPIAYLCNGQRVPEDVQLARKEIIEELLVTISEKFLEPVSQQLLAHAYAGGRLDVVE